MPFWIPSMPRNVKWVLQYVLQRMILMKQEFLSRKFQIILGLLMALVILILLYHGAVAISRGNTDSIYYDAKSYDDIDTMLHSGKPVIIAFGADYCPVCENYLPYIKELNALYGDEIIVKFVDTVENEEIRSVYNIELIPSTLFFTRSGEVYKPSDEIEIDKSEQYDGELRYKSEIAIKVNGDDIGYNTAFEYGMGKQEKLVYCKYVGLIDMTHLKQIAEDLLKE
jgi:thiol-disulfide isomerase/thioredoxin